jgi:hypothetical protein
MKQGRPIRGLVAELNTDAVNRSMQELVSLRMSVLQLAVGMRLQVRYGLTMLRYQLVETVEEITTDRLYVSDEAIRVIDHLV